MSTLAEVPPVKHKREVLDQAVIRFAGDSGDGMQITGSQFTNTAALYGNDIATFPDYPAEIRAPAGTIPGVSGFQLHFSSNEVYTPGDAIDVLIAMNPAALKVNVADLKANGILIVNSDSFKENDLRKAQMTSNPLEDHSLDKFRLFSVELERLTRRSLEHLGLDAKSMDRCKNFFALGMCYWLYNRSMEPTVRWIEDKFKNKPLLVEANKLTLKGGYSYCEATEAFQISYEIPPAQLTPGLYRSMSGNQALALGFVTAAQKSGLTLFQGSYPITPASDILHELSQYKDFGVMTFQAEDEIAAVTSAIGAAYAGALAITTTSGPGMALKTEAMGLAVAVEIPLVICDIQRLGAAYGGGLGVTATSGPGLCLKSEAVGLAVMTELPVVILDVQRGGPSTGLPTKTEQADLLQALFGRNSEAPIPVLAASTPADCFWVAIEASRIAVKYMVPVIILSDGYLANGAEPWRIPELSDIPDFPVKFASDPNGFLPYKRNPQTLARPWAVPGTPGLEHRIGGLEKQDPTGNINYEPLNHENMVRIRAAKVAAVAKDIPNVLPAGDPEGDLLIVAWGSTSGSITAALKAQRLQGRKIGHLHLRYLNPLPSNLGDIFKRYKKILVPELNMGQLLWVLRAKFLVDAVGLNKIQGRPFKQAELEQKIEEMLGL